MNNLRRTVWLNLFRGEIPPDPQREQPPIPFTLVDLPGYGYAKASKQVQSGWDAMIEGYLMGRPNLVLILVMVDGEIGPTALDLAMLQ